MTIYVSCQFCNFSFEVDGKHAGHNIKCPACSGLVSVPSGLDFMEEKTTNCPVCGSSVDKEEEICSECSSNIKSKEIIAVEQLPEAIKRPQNIAPANSIVKSLAVFLLFLAVGAGTFVYFQRKQRPPTPAFGLLPVETRVLAVFDFERLAAVVSQSKSSEQTLAKYFQGEMVRRFDQLFSSKLKISAAQDVKRLYMAGVDERFFIPGDREFSGLLVIKGDFDADAFHEYARISAPNLGLQEEHRGYSILKTQALISQKRQKWMFALLDKETLIAASDIVLIRKVIDLNLGKGKALTENFGDGILSRTALWKFYGEFSDDFFQAPVWLTEIDREHRYLLDMKTISFDLDLGGQKFTARLKSRFYTQNPALVEKKLGKQMDAEIQNVEILYENLPRFPVSNEEFAAIIADLKAGVKGEKGELDISWKLEGKRCESFLSFLYWRLQKGPRLLMISRNWAKIERMHAAGDPKTREEVTKFLQAYPGSPFYQKARNLLQFFQKQASEQDLENRAKQYYQELTAGMTPENELSYWPKLANFSSLYENTVWGQAARDKRKEITKNVLAMIRGKNDRLAVMVEESQFSDLDSLEKEVNEFLHNSRILTSMEADAPNLGKLLQKLTFELARAREASKKYLVQSQELYRQLCKDCSDFTEIEFPKMIASRKFDELELQLREFEEESRKINVEKKQAQELIDKARKNAREIRKLFLLVAKVFGNRKKKGKKIEILLIGKSGRKSLKGKVKKVARDGFTIKSNGKKIKLPYDKLTSRTLSKYMRRKDREKPKVAYYLGLLYFYEGQKKEYVLRALKGIKKGEYKKRAQLLQEKLENQ